MSIDLDMVSRIADETPHGHRPNLSAETLKMLLDHTRRQGRAYQDALQALAAAHEQGRVVLKDLSYIEKLEALARAVAPLVAEWRPTPKFDDDVWQKRQDVVLAFDALEKFSGTTSEPTPGPASPDDSGSSARSVSGDPGSC